MCHSVIIKITRCRKSFATNGAFMRFFSAMDSSVCIEAGRCRKSFFANVTDMRSFPGMRPQMPVKQWRPVKTFSAKRTGQHFLMRGTWRIILLIFIFDDQGAWTKGGGSWSSTFRSDWRRWRSVSPFEKFRFFRGGQAGITWDGNSIFDQEWGKGWWDKIGILMVFIIIIVDDDGHKW